MKKGSLKVLFGVIVLVMLMAGQAWGQAGAAPGGGTLGTPGGGGGGPGGQVSGFPAGSGGGFPAPSGGGFPSMDTRMPETGSGTGTGSTMGGSGTGSGGLGTSEYGPATVGPYPPAGGR